MIGDRFYGLYRGKCILTKSDGHITIQVPQVTGTQRVVANPCFSVDKDRIWSGGDICTELPSERHFDVPNVGETVWVMYEGGDPDRPVWMGVYK